jgi:hypothetical protein
VDESNRRTQGSSLSPRVVVLPLCCRATLQASRPLHSTTFSTSKLTMTLPNISAAEARADLSAFLPFPLASDPLPQPLPALPGRTTCTRVKVVDPLGALLILLATAAAITPEATRTALRLSRSRSRTFTMRSTRSSFRLFSYPIRPVARNERLMLVMSGLVGL